ncbi:hypothetical protein EDB83DRAFT_2319578 [Lactarius deliciosus]|nr:hypothetical protein EDB83DRAFT_2319578 [Lactarius deliciosus]
MIVNCQSFRRPRATSLLPVSYPQTPLLAAVATSQTPPMASSPSNSQAIFCAFLEIYNKKTKKNVLAHPLMAPVVDLQLFLRHPPHSDPTVRAIYYVRPWRGRRLRIEGFFRQLEEYSEVPTTEAMRDIVVKITAWNMWDCDEGDEARTRRMEAVGDKDNVAIEDGKVVKVTPMVTLSTHYHLFQGEFGAADLGVSHHQSHQHALSLLNATRPGLGPRPREEASGLELRRNRRWALSRSSPDDGSSGGDGNSLVPVPFPRAVSGEYGGAPSSTFNTPSQSQSPSFESGRACEASGASSRRRQRPNSYDEFGAKPRRSRFESMVNLGVASGEQASASDLMVRDATEGSMSRRLSNLAIVSDAGSLALYRALNLNTGKVGWTTCNRSDVAHCDLKAVNILTTKTRDVKLSDFGVSLNLRAMEREIKDVTGTRTGWSLKPLSSKARRPSPTSGDSGPLDARLSNCSRPLFAFPKGCFHRARQNNRDLQPQDRIPFLWRVSADLQKNGGSARQLMANLERDSPIPVYAGQPFDGDMAMLFSSPARQVIALLWAVHHQSPVKLRKAKQTSLRYANIPLSRRPLANFFMRLPDHHPANANSSRGNLDRDRDKRERERMNSPQLSLTSSPHQSIAFLYMHLAVLKPADRSDNAWGISSILDQVRSFSQHRAEISHQMQGRKRKRQWDAEGQGIAKTAQSHRVRGASCGNKVHCPLPPKSPFSVTHFDERGTPPAPQGRHSLFDYGMLSQAHVLKLGRSRTGLITLALSPFVRKCTATDIPALYCFCARTFSPPSPPPLLLSRLSMGSPHAAPGRLRPLAHDADGAVWIAPGWRVWSVGEDLLSARGRGSAGRRHALWNTFIVCSLSSSVMTDGIYAARIEGIGLVANDVTASASQDAPVDIFERIESFFRWLEEYSEVPTTEAMRDVVVKMMVGVLGIFWIVTKEMKVEAVGDKVNVAIEGSQSDANGNLLTHYKRPSRPIAIRKPSGNPLPWLFQAVSADAFPGEFGAADLGVRCRRTARDIALKDANALLRRDLSPDASSLRLGPSPGRLALHRDSARGGQRSGTYVPRRSSSDDSGIGGDGDSLVPIPFPRVVSGAPSSSPLNTRSRSQSPSFDPVERTTSKKRGRFQSEVDGASSRRWPRPNSYDEFGAKPRRSRFESMVNLGVASGEQASASDLMARDATEGSVSRQTLVVREEGRAPTHFFGAVYRALNLNTGQMVAVKRIGLEGLKEEEISQLMREVDLVKRLSHPSIVKYEGMARDENTLSIVLEYAENGSLGQTLKAFGKLNEKLVASYVDVVHCDLKAANILTTKTGNVKLSDFGVSLNLRAMEREIKDVAGTPNWMAPEVIELKGASPKSDIWSLGCTVIELLTGRPPWGYWECYDSRGRSPPIPERFSGPLVAFLKECFHKDPSMRPSAGQLFEHEWLKNHWGLNKHSFPSRVSADLQKNGGARHLMANLELDSPIPVYAGQQFDGDMAMLSSSPGHRSFTGSASPVLPEVPQSETTFGKRASPTISEPANCRVCMEPAKTGAVLCSHCSLFAHSKKCAGRAALTYDLRSKLLMHAHFAERGNSPAEFFTRLPNHHPASASSSRGSLDRDRDQRERERTNSPLLFPTSSPHPPIVYKVLSPFSKRSRASLTPDPTHSNSSVSLAGATPPPHSHSQTKVTIPEGNVIRRKLTIILTRQREPQQVINTHLRERPQSISSIGSSCANSPQSPASQSPQSNSLRSLQAVVATTGNSSSSSSASRAARVDPSAATTASSFVDAAVDVEGASCVTVPDTAVPTVASRDKKRMMTMTRRARGDSSKASNGSNCSIQ